MRAYAPWALVESRLAQRSSMFLLAAHDVYTGVCDEACVYASSHTMLAQRHPKMKASGSLSGSIVQP